MRKDLELALEQRNLGKLQQILSSNQKDIQNLGIDVLFWVASNKYFQADQVDPLNILRNSGFDLNKKCRFNHDTELFPIEVPTLYGSLSLLKILLVYGARANIDGQQLVHAYNQIEMVKLLLENGADPNRVSEFGTTLYKAAEGGYLESVQLLLHYGANPTLVCERSGLTALQIAQKNGHMKVCEVLQKAFNHNNNRDLKESLFLAFEEKNELRILKILTELENLASVEKNLQALGIDSPINLKQLIDSPDRTEQIFVCLAVQMNSPLLLEKILKLGARVDAVNRLGWSALYIAACRDYKDCVDLLLKAGANTKITDPFGETALQRAQECGYTDVVNLLKKAEKPDGVDENKENKITSQLEKLLEDPITHDVMDSPIIACKNQHSFDRKSLLMWYNSSEKSHDKCPTCRETIPDPSQSKWPSSLFARQMLDAYRDEQKSKTKQSEKQIRP